jgi:hypothetical protein
MPVEVQELEKYQEKEYKVTQKRSIHNMEVF